MVSEGSDPYRKVKTSKIGKLGMVRDFSSRIKECKKLGAQQETGNQGERGNGGQEGEVGGR